ncbi:MAG: diguanylate cyclase [Gammaproteobacteria bacterium]|nr:diguanylate cyclase [Gammaproteobacteria bacterium]
MDRLAQQVAQAKRHKHQLAVFYLDLDQFKHVNDRFGRQAALGREPAPVPPAARVRQSVPHGERRLPAAGPGGSGRAVHPVHRGWPL